MKATFKEHCIVLRNKGHTLLEIVRITKRPKTSVYFHIRDLPLRADRLQQYRVASAVHIRKFALARKGKSTRPFKKFDVWIPRKVLLIAHLLFDGEIKRRQCAYSNRSETLLRRFENLMSDVYAFPSKRYVNIHTGVTRSMYFNVELGEYLQQKSTELIQAIPHLPAKFKIEFLRAFFDDEGCMDFRPSKKKRVRGYQKDTAILTLVHQLLSDINIASRIILPNEVVISGKENLLKFQKEINFSSGVRINGLRSNSIWKESLEKRELLRRAIASFKD